MTYDSDTIDQRERKATVTVAMPVYNGGSDLRTAVLSVVHQTFTDWRLLLIDDGSSDGAVAALSDIDDSRISVFSDGRNLGLAARLNQAIDLADGEFIARMDQDDIAYPTRFAAQVERLRSQPDLDLLAVRAVSIDESNRVFAFRPAPLDHAAICARPWLGFYMPHPGWMGRTRWFREQRYASPGPYFCEDQELLLRSHHGSRFATLDQVLLAYRVKGSINHRKLARTRRTLLGVQLRHFLSHRQPLNSVLAVGGYLGRRAADHVRHLGALVSPRTTKRPAGGALATEQATLDRHLETLSQARTAGDAR